MLRITQDDSDDLALVLWAIACEAINWAEFRAWVLRVIEHDAAPPDYVFDLLDFQGTFTDLHKIIGFVPGWEPTDDEMSALSGIAIRRGRRPFEAVDEPRCLAALARHPGLVQRLREMIPSVDIAFGGT